MDNIIRILKKYGFTESEIKVYISLLKYGSMTGYESAKKSGVSRSKIYDILQSLVNKNLVMTSTNNNSTDYTAHSSNRVLQMLKEDFKKNTETLESEFKKFETKQDDEHIWNIIGKNVTFLKIKEIINSAEKQIYIQIWKQDLTQELEEELLKKEKKGVDIVLVLYSEEKDYETRLRNVYRHGFEDEKLKEVSGRWINISIDNREMIYSAINEKSFNGIIEKECTGIYTKNKSMVYFATEYIIHDVYCLKLIQDMKKLNPDESKKYIEEVRKVIK